MANQGVFINVKNNGAFNPEMKHVIISDEFPDDRTLDIPINITGYVIDMDIKTNPKTGVRVLIESFSTSDGSISITDAANGIFKPLKADITGWAKQIAVADIVMNDATGDALNDPTENIYINIIDKVTDV